MIERNCGADVTAVDTAETNQANRQPPVAYPASLVPISRQHLPHGGSGASPGENAGKGTHERAYALLASLMGRLFALVILGLAAPLMLLIAVAIRLDSPGGAIFTQQRIARIRRKNARRPASHRRESHRDNGEQDADIPTFTLYKFRTYHTNLNHLVPKRAQFDFDPTQIDHVQLQLRNDPRITRVGRILRRTSLDELPNFVNVLKGEMRLIGPRPEVREMYRYYTEEQKQKFEVEPGITGLAQVNGRGKLNFKQTVEYDLYYVRNRSWLLNLKILLRTLKVVITGDGSY